MYSQPSLSAGPHLHLTSPGETSRRGSRGGRSTEPGRRRLRRLRTTGRPGQIGHAVDSEGTLYPGPVRPIYHTPAFFCAKQTHFHGMYVPMKATVETKSAPFHLFFAKSAWNMNVGLLAWPPPPMPAPEPRAATRADSLLSADTLQKQGNGERACYGVRGPRCDNVEHDSAGSGLHR